MLQDRYIYTFENICKEDRNIFLEDGASKVFVNTRGHIGEVSEELKHFFDYINSDIVMPNDDYINQINNDVETINANEAERTRIMGIMTMEMNHKLDLGDAYQSGIEIGEKRGIQQGKLQAIEEVMLRLLKSGYSSEEIAAIIALPVSYVEEVKELNEQRR